MKFWILLLLLITVVVECRERRKNKHKKYDVKEVDDIDDSFDISSWFMQRRNRERRRDSFKNYSTLRLDRNIFYYWDTAYESWTNWTACNPVTCLSTRNRKCKGNSWQERVQDFRVEIKCPVRFIYERKKCTNVKQCKVDPVSTNNNVSTFLPEICGKRPDFIETKVYGGKKAVKNSWPWHGGLYVIGRTANYICGATIINPGWAITAAHCLLTIKSINRLPLGQIIDTRKNDLFNKFQLLFGDHDRREKEKSEKAVKISHFIIHPLFKADFTSNYYDVALLKLDKIIPQQSKIDFACIPDSLNYSLPTSTKCMAIGWGYVTPEDPFDIWSLEFSLLFQSKPDRKPVHATVLQEVEIPLVDFNSCKKSYKSFNLQESIHLCAGADKKDTCRGDSGGGLFCLDPKTNRWQLYGVTNFGSARGCGYRHGVYVRVTALAKWIRDTLKLDIV